MDVPNKKYFKQKKFKVLIMKYETKYYKLKWCEAYLPNVFAEFILPIESKPNLY